MKYIPVIEPYAFKCGSKGYLKKCLHWTFWPFRKDGIVLLVKKILYKFWGCLQKLFCHPMIKIRPGGSILWLRMWVSLILLVPDIEETSYICKMSYFLSPCSSVAQLLVTESWPFCDKLFFYFVLLPTMDGSYWRIINTLFSIR